MIAIVIVIDEWIITYYEVRNMVPDLLLYKYIVTVLLSVAVVVVVVVVVIFEDRSTVSYASCVFHKDCI